MKLSRLIIIIFLIFLIDSFTAFCEDKFVVDSVPCLYYGKIQNRDAYSLLNNYKVDSNQAKYEIDTIRNLEIEFEYYLYFKPGQQSFIFIKKNTDSLFSKYYCAQNFQENLFKEDDNYTLHFRDYLFTLINITKDTIDINFKYFNDQYHGHTVFSSTKAAKVAEGEQNINEFLKYAVNDYSDVYKSDQFPKIWINAQYMNPSKTEFRLQGYYMNLWDLETNGILSLNISCPSFTIRKDNGKYMFSHQFATIPITFGLILLAEGYDQIFPPKKDSIMKGNSANIFIWLACAAGMVSVLPSILNIGIDFPFSYGDHYTALTFKLNGDMMIAAANLSQGYLEAKFGFRYIYNKSIGAEFQVGYRFWEKPDLVSEEHTWYGVSILLPIR